MIDDERGSPSRRLWGRAVSRDLRRRSTPSERLLWEALRNHRLDGRQFRRQHPIGRYIVDFACPRERLVVEVDGDVHEAQREYDAERDDYLRSLGYTVLRFTVDRVLNDLSGVLFEVKSACGSPPLLSIAMGRELGGGASSDAVPRSFVKLHTMDKRLRDAYYDYCDELARANIIDHTLNNAILDGKTIEERIVAVLRAAGQLPEGWKQDDGARRSA
jgi:very-short-patch-repair endonuclease